MKKNKIIIILSIGLLVTAASFYSGGRNWIKDNSKDYIKNCNYISIGDSRNIVIEKMGQPNSKLPDESIYIYYAGGLKTEKGFSFHFKNDVVTEKNCSI